MELFSADNSDGWQATYRDTSSAELHRQIDWKVRQLVKCSWGNWFFEATTSSSVTFSIDATRLGETLGFTASKVLKEKI